MTEAALVKHLWACKTIKAKDGCELRELLHPHRDPAELPYSLAVAELAPGTASQAHRLEQTEVYFILEGQGQAHLDGTQHRLGPGDALVIPAGASQWIENVGTGQLRFAALVSPPWTADGDQPVTAA